VAELALDDVQWHALAREFEFERVRVAQVVWGEAPVAWSVLLLDQQRRADRRERVEALDVTVADAHAAV
jgi:hypothetical protein